MSLESNFLQVTDQKQTLIAPIQQFISNDDNNTWIWYI